MGFVRLKFCLLLLLQLLFFHKGASQQLSKFMTKVFDSLYHSSVATLLNQHISDSEPKVGDDTLLAEMCLASQLSNDIYSHSIQDGIVICSDSKKLPECVIKLIKDELWIVLRGTMSGTDLLRDMSWMVATPFSSSSGSSSSFSVPAGVILQANQMTELIMQVVQKEFKNHPIRRVRLTGHSLGGSIATVIYLNLALKRQFALPMRVYTFGAPNSIAHYDRNHTSSHALAQLEPNVLNIIYQLDVIPRLMAAPHYPDYLFLSQLYGSRGIMRQASAGYRPYGRYLSARKEGELYWVKNTTAFMGTFPPNEAHFVYSIVNDHSMSGVLRSLKRIYSKTRR